MGINEQEEQYILAPEFFAPYEEKAFIMIPFNYLVTDHAVLVGPFGVSQSIEKTDALEQVTTAEQLFELENRQEKVNYNQRHSIIFYDFIKRFVANYNHNVHSVTDMYWLSPPTCIGRLEAIQLNNISKSLLTKSLLFRNDKSLEIVRENELMRVDINQ